MRKAYSLSLNTMLRPSDMSVGRMRASMLKPFLRFRPGVEVMVSAGLAPGRHDPARPSSLSGGGGAADKVHAVKRHTAILMNRPFAHLGMGMSVVARSAADFRRELFVPRRSCLCSLDILELHERDIVSASAIGYMIIVKDAE